MVLTDDAMALETRHLGFTISPHEECGVEEAVRLIEANGGESVVLTLGPPEAVEQLRDAMALGIDRAIHLQTDAAGRAQGALSNDGREQDALLNEEWDPQATAAAIVEAIRADESATGPFDLVFLGNESADSGGFQVAARVAHALGRPLVTGLKRVALDGTSVRCEQEVEGGRDVYVVPLPAVLTVKEGLNLPRYPSVPGRMRAGRKPVALSTPSRPASRLELVKLVVPEGHGKRAEVLGSGPVAAPAVVEMLSRIGVV
jgi:electron transfer flavoprotein beta subunit